MKKLLAVLLALVMVLSLAACGAAPAGANGDAAALGKADEVRNDQKIVHKAHFVDHIQLII